MSFQQQIRKTPAVNVDYWSFAIFGRVRQPLILSYAELYALPAQTVRSALTCGGMAGKIGLMSEAEWTGVALADLLDRVTTADDARYARMYAVDGYSAILPIEALPQTTLAYAMNGAPLPPEHGYPVRLVAPGLQGYKMPKWINRIELSDSAEGGFWEARGWSLDGLAAPTVAILSHEQTADGAVELNGVAYAGAEPITSVQVMIDGASGADAELLPSEPFGLTHWRIWWQPPGTGDYEIRAQATSASARTSAETRKIVRIR